MNTAVTQDVVDTTTSPFNADGSVVVSTASGKKITIKRPHVLAQYKLVEALGDAAENRVFLRMCIPLMWVNAIDGNPVPAPATRLQVDGLIGRLDEEGIAAVSEGIETHFGEKDTAAVAKK